MSHQKVRERMNIYIKLEARAISQCLIHSRHSTKADLTLLLLLSHFSCVRLCVTPSTAAHQAPPSLGFSRQEHRSRLPFPSPMHESEKWKWSRSVVSDSYDLQPTRLLHKKHQIIGKLQEQILPSIHENTGKDGWRPIVLSGRLPKLFYPNNKRNDSSTMLKYWR